VIRLNAAEELAGLCTGALLLAALALGALPKLLSTGRSRRQSVGPVPPPPP